MIALISSVGFGNPTETDALPGSSVLGLAGFPKINATIVLGPTLLVTLVVHRATLLGRGMLGCIVHVHYELLLQESLVELYNWVRPVCEIAGE